MIITRSKVRTESVPHRFALRSLVTLVVLGIVAGYASAESKPAAAESKPSAPPVQVNATIRKDVVDAFARKLEGDYAYAEVGAKMASAIRKKLAAGGYNGVTAVDEFASALQADVRAIVNDKHLRVSFDPRPIPNFGPLPGTASKPRAPAPGESPPPMPDLRKDNGAITRLQILAGNVGYIEVNGMPPMASEAIDAAFAFLRNTDALIIDLRGNGGGSPDTVAYYMSYLSEGEPYPVMRIQTRHEGIRETRTTNLGERSYGRKKPVFVLTSYLTFSGGEELAYDVQAFKRGSIVGEITGGGANPGTMQPLGHGFVAFVPFGYGVHPATGTNWEGVGVKPDFVVPARLAATEAHRLAVERLRAEVSEPMRHSRLETLAQSLALQTKNEAPAAQRLSDAERRLIGTYVPVGEIGPSLSVVEKEGVLVYLPSRGRPPSRLVPLGNDAYRLDGLPDDFVARFTYTPEGKVRLLVEGSMPAAPVMEKR